MTARTDEQRTLLAKIQSLAEIAAQQEASAYLCRHQKASLLTELRLTGWTTPRPGVSV